MSRVALALVHHPVVDREGAVITTAITNLDLHDIARSATTFGLSDVFIVHPIAAQRELAERIKSHWVGGSGAKRIPTREPAMALLRIVPTIEDAYEAMGGRGAIDTFATSAQDGGRACLPYAQARRVLASSGRPALLLFGTGWGLASGLLESASHFLAPIRGVGPGGYNHLSVRAACAIILDRLLGGRSGED